MTGKKLTIKLLIKGLINILDRATFTFSHISNSQVNPKMRTVDNWFVIGTTSRSTARKLVKILKYTKKSVGCRHIRPVCDEIFGASSVPGMVEDIQQNLPILNAVLRSVKQKTAKDRAKDVIALVHRCEFLRLQCSTHICFAASI